MWFKENWFKIVILFFLLFFVLEMVNFLQEKNRISRASAYSECRAKIAELDGKVPDILKLSNACENVLSKKK